MRIVELFVAFVLFVVLGVWFMRRTQAQQDDPEIIQLHPCEQLLKEAFIKSRGNNVLLEEICEDSSLIMRDMQAYLDKHKERYNYIIEPKDNRVVVSKKWYLD